MLRSEETDTKSCGNRKRSREDESSSIESPPHPLPSPQATPVSPPKAAQRTRNEINSGSRRDNPTVSPIDFTSLPEELKNVDFSQRVSWRKYAPYPIDDKDKDNNNSESTTVCTNSSRTLPLTPPSTPPEFSPSTPALCFHVHAIDGRARATTLHFSPSDVRGRDEVPTPMFMPVGTKGTIKSLTTEEITDDPALDCPIILANTYHLALEPGTELVRDMGSIHKFMAWDRPLLTDSGGFQMVSLLKLAEITEEGVTFESPYADDRASPVDSTSSPPTDITPPSDTPAANNPTDPPSPNPNQPPQPPKTKRARMLLRPEDSIQHQINIGSTIMMALDDVVSSLDTSPTRHLIATYRTLRWYDRCRSAHTTPTTQNLFPIVQGGLDITLGGLRERCLAGLRIRDAEIPGYAIGGLAGGEEKSSFWRVVDRCCRALPDDKPRYLMGVGYPLDLVVCTALGVDMYDCVYPTRTARFGVALVDGADAEGGTMRLKSQMYAEDGRILVEGCGCPACKGGFKRSRLHELLKVGNPVAATLLTAHNVAYMMSLVRGMRAAIFEGTYGEFVRGFVGRMFDGKDVPVWVRDALVAAGIQL